MGGRGGSHGPAFVHVYLCELAGVKKSTHINACQAHKENAVNKNACLALCQMMMTYLKHSQRFGSREVSTDYVACLVFGFFFFRKGGGGRD